jgi:hypothetical protein
MSKTSLLVLCAVVLSGCSHAPYGVLYSDSQAGAAISSNQAGNRVGQSCATSILGLVATGDATIEAARRAGGITLITSVDESVNSVFIFYTKYCTIVRGR